MEKLVTILLLLSLSNISLGQNISRNEADKLLGAMKSSKSDQERISLLLKIAKFHIFKEGEAKADLDSGWVSIIQAEQLNKVLRSPVHEGNILLLKAYYLKEKGQQDLGKASAEKAIAVLKKENDMYLLGESYAELSQHYSYKTDLDKKIGLVEQAVVCFEKAGPTERKARCYEELGDLYFHKRDKISSQKALAALDSSLKAYQSINYPKLQGVYILYSTVYSQTADVKNGLHYALLALQTAEKLRDTSMQLCQINYIVSMTYFNLREYDKALPYQYKALSIAEKYHDINSIYLIGKNICITHLHKNDALEAQKVLDRIVEKYPQPSDVATTIDQISIRIRISEQLNQLRNLEKYCSKLASMLDSVKLSNSFMISSYHVLIKGLLKLKRYSLARHYLKKEQEFIKLVPFSARSATFYNSWFSLDTATKDYKSAVYHLLEYNKANDSIFNQGKAQQLQQLQVEYDIESKDKNILLLTQEKQLQDAELKRSALERRIIIAAAALLLIILFLLFKQFRLKQRSSKAIQKKNAVLEHMVTEKEWLLKEVHHRVKNNLQTVVSLLELQSENLQDEALSAIQDSQNRIYAMSLIHQKLYQTDNIASINIQPYLLELIGHLQAIYSPDRKISFDLRVAPLELDVSQAIPVGLIVNEAVTNSIKHAFNNQPHQPQISIVLDQHKKQSIKLLIADNGMGLPPNFDSTAAPSLGFKLINALVDDIEGELTVESDDGTHISVVFNASEPFDEKVAIPAEKAYAV